jgi:hypothetical protein
MGNKTLNWNLCMTQYISGKPCLLVLYAQNIKLEFMYDTIYHWETLPVSVICPKH